MRKFAAVAVVLLSLFAVSTPQGFSQSRARRVGGTAPTTPTSRTNTPAAPSATPVLRGGTPATTATPRPQSTGAATGNAAQTRPAPARQQDESSDEEVDDEGVVRVNTALVTIPVSVLDRDGRYIGDIRKEEFRLFEDGVEQQITYFAQVDVPFTVALVIDTSNSTKFRLEDIQDAAIAFVNQLGRDDRVLVVSFDSEVRVLAEATSDRRLLSEAIRRTRTGGGTKLYDAVDFVAKQRLNRVKGRKAIVLFTDGVDTQSNRASYDSTLADAEELDTIIYPVAYDTYTQMQAGGGGGSLPGRYPRTGGGGVGGVLGDILAGVVIGRRGGPVTVGRGGGGPGTSRAEYERGGRYLRELAQRTGGRYQEANDLTLLSRSFANIAEELRRQYSLGYQPKRQSQAVERRNIRVRVFRPNLAVRARDSYIYKPAGATDADLAAAQDARQPRPASAPELRRRPFDRVWP